MTSTEVWFYRAEAAEKFGTEDFNTTMFKAMSSSFDDLGLTSDAVYINSLINGIADKDKLIAVQMWIAMNGTSQPAEGWIATRKFGDYFTAPGGLFIEPVDNLLGAGKYPSILLYPQTEVATNPNFPGQHVLTDKVFWDN
jgi:hypothetical protein